MKTIKLLFLFFSLFIATLSVAQPVLGMTTFFTNTTTIIAPNTACVSTKTTTLSGWLLSVSSTSNCGFSWTNSSGGDGRAQYLMGFGTLTQATFGSDDGSEFALQNLTWGVGTSSLTSKQMKFTGYKNGLAVPGASLNATTPSGTGVLNETVVTFTSTTAFNNVDEVRLSPAPGFTCNTTLFFEDITIGAAIPPCPTPTLSLTGKTNVLCNGSSTGSATMSASGGSGFTYTWSPSGGNGATASGLSAGNYTCITNNSCGATASATVNITQPSALATSTAVTNVSCNGGSNGSATVTASGGTAPYTYLWSTAATTSFISSQPAGVKTVTVTDANGCKIIKTVTITQPTAISPTTVVTNVSCNGGSNGSITVTGASSYAWNTGANTSSITGLLAAVYTCTLTSAIGCTVTINATVTQPSALSITSAVTDVSCNGDSNGSATVTASGGAGGYTYLWTPSGGTGATANGLAAGTYTCTITDANSCAETAVVTITQPTVISATTAITNVSCNGGSNGSATVTASGATAPYTYAWNNGANTSSITGLLAAVYTCTLTSATGCTLSINATVTQPSALSITSAVTDVSCNGDSNGSATVTASGGAGGYTYLWAPSGGSGATANGLAAGNYTCTVTDANSCTETAVATITQPTAISATTAITNVSCNGGSNGSAAVTASGGAGGYTYSWAPSGGAGATASGLAVGNYTCTITDGNSCTKTAFATITQPTAITTTTAITNVSCNSGSNGSATVTASGATAPYAYSWTPSGGAGATANGLAAGNYTCTVTDANSCVKTALANITQPNILTTSATTSSILCYGGIASVTVSANGGTSAYVGTGTFTSTAGVKTYTVTDANGCAATTSITITEPTALNVSSTSSAILCNGGVSTVTVSATDGTSPYVGTGTYTVNAGTTSYTVTDNNGCAATTSITVTEPIAPTITGTTPNSRCGNGTVVLGATSSVGVVNWYNAATGGTAIATGTSYVTNTLSVTATYYVDATNAGCTTSSRTAVIATINPNVTPSIVIAQTVGTNPICSGAPSTFTATPTNGGSIPAYQWKVNGGNIGTNSPTYTTTSLTNGQSVTCILTSNAACVSTATVVSSAITMTVNTCAIVIPLQTTVPCGNTYGNLSTYAVCQPISGATNYRFNFYDNTTNTLLATKTQTSNLLYFNTFTGLNYGKTYKWSVEVEYFNGTSNVFGPASSNSCTITFSPPKTTVPCGNTYGNLSTYAVCHPISKATNYRFNFYDNTTNTLLATKTQTSNLLYFNTFTGLNYGKTYKWTVEVEYFNGTSNVFGPASSNSCTITFSAPKTTVPCGNTYGNLSTYAVCQPISKATNYRFNFYENTTNALLATKTQTSNLLYFNTFTGLNYGKTYKWTVEVEYFNGTSNVFGPASSNSCTITFSAPQTTIPCGNTYGNLSTYAVCQPISGATNYRFNFYNNTTNALLATKTQTSNLLYFNTVSGLAINNAYKWTVQAEYFNGTSNVFGPASSNSCTITFGTAPPIIPIELIPENSTSRALLLSSTNEDEIQIKLFPNPTKDITYIESSESVESIKIFSNIGQLIFISSSNKEINLTDNAVGLYFIEIQTKNTTKHFQIIKD